MTGKILLLCAFLCEIAVLRTAAHTHHLHSANKERESDGGRSPRDHGHYADGEHNSEFDHEAILGSVKDAEEYDQLPASEAKRRLEILLVKMDRNNDKNIDRKELHSWILRSFRMLSEEESSERLDEVDDDEDGYVTWSEYISETYGINDPEDQELLGKSDQDEEQKLLREDRELFNAADKNIDGRLDEKEFLAFTHPEEHPDMLPVILRQTLEDKDANNDGLIDFQEYIGDKGASDILDKNEEDSEKSVFDKHDLDGDGALHIIEAQRLLSPTNVEVLQGYLNKYRNKNSSLRKMGNPGGKEQDREWLLTEKDKFDNDHDIDRNGVLDRNEILSWVVPSNEDIAEDEVDHLFAAADDDADQLLSFLEVLDHHDVFVGSEATDYGDHLHNLDRFEDEL